jgi:hypothetical protein
VWNKRKEKGKEKEKEKEREGDGDVTRRKVWRDRDVREEALVPGTPHGDMNRRNNTDFINEGLEPIQMWVLLGNSGKNLTPSKRRVCRNSRDKFSSNVRKWQPNLASSRESVVHFRVVETCEDLESRTREALKSRICENPESWTREALKSRICEDLESWTCEDLESWTREDMKSWTREVRESSEIQIRRLRCMKIRVQEIRKPVRSQVKYVASKVWVWRVN